MAPGFASIAAKYVGVTLVKVPLRPGRLAVRIPAGSAPPHDRFGILFGIAALLLLAGFFVWHDPLHHGPAAAALVAMLALDTGSRLAAEAASRRSGVAVAIRGLPSLILSLGAPGAAALCLVPALVGAAPFPVLASLVAGLLAMGACARLALARSVLALARVEERRPSARP